MTVKRARINDGLALLTALLIIVVDQWTKALVVEYLSPPDSGHLTPVIGDYLTLYYIQNRGAAFSMLTNSALLFVLIIIAIGVIAYLYWRIFNTGSLLYKLIFGMIIGGATGNIIDRFVHGGYVVDFIYFQIQQIGFHFAVFNVADANISVGVFLLFVLILFGGLRKTESVSRSSDKSPEQAPRSGTLR